MIPGAHPLMLNVENTTPGTPDNGRKRFIVTDTLGLLLTVVVVTASVQDRDGAKPALLEAYLSTSVRSSIQFPTSVSTTRYPRRSSQCRTLDFPVPDMPVTKITVTGGTSCCFPRATSSPRCCGRLETRAFLSSSATSHHRSFMSAHTRSWRFGNTLIGPRA
jgi:hypothetical protein